MRSFLIVAFLLCFIASSGIAQTRPSSQFPSESRSASPSASSPSASSPSASQPNSMSLQDVEQKLEGDFGVNDIAATSSWVHSLQLADWLGPLAPLALSPFFGMACLSGLALYGPEWVTDNALLGASGPLQNETLFFVFVGLTLLTSLPRLTKVSKPFAQAVDQIETYSVIVILLMIKFLADTSGAAEEGTQIAMVQLGVFSVTIDTLLAIAMVVNIVVVNSVKFFFEFLVWLTPIPALDAIFEICNKTLCGALMAVYVFSPTIATVINLIILAVALVVFRWMSRRVRFYRTMAADPILARLFSGYGEVKDASITVFPRCTVGPFKPKSRVKLAKCDKGWSLSEASWFLPANEHTVTSTSKPLIRRGWLTHWIEFPSAEGKPIVLIFSRRYDGAMQQLADSLSLELGAEPEMKTEAAVEFA